MGLWPIFHFYPPRFHVPTSEQLACAASELLAEGGRFSCSGPTFDRPHRVRQAAVIGDGAVMEGQKRYVPA